MASWHQSNAQRTNHGMRRFKAHVIDNSRYGFYAICGQRVPRITVSAKHADNPANHVCKNCQRKLAQRTK